MREKAARAGATAADSRLVVAEAEARSGCQGNAVQAASAAVASAANHVRRLMPPRAASAAAPDTAALVDTPCPQDLSMLFSFVAHAACLLHDMQSHSAARTLP
jgi:hypothetical protein